VIRFTLISAPAETGNLHEIRRFRDLNHLLTPAPFSAALGSAHNAPSPGESVSRKDKEAAAEKQAEFAKVRYTSNGTAYVDVPELMKTRKMRENMEKMKRARPLIHGTSQEPTDRRDDR